MRPTDVADFEVLLVGSRSGVGKTSVAYQVSEQWQAAGVAHCLIYVNTVNVLERAMIVRAMGRSTAVHGVLLTATDETVRRRLTGREIGTALGAHLRRSATMAVHLDGNAEDWVVRVPTDGRLVADVAAHVARATGWSATT